MEMRTFIDVPYADNSRVKKLGAVWDEEDKGWYIPESVPPEKFRDFNHWFSDSIWRGAPECPVERDPIKWGKALFSQLGEWAIDRRLSPGSLRYWDINQGVAPIEECCSEHSVVQILWPRGPSMWAVRLLQRSRYSSFFRGSGYFLEPIDDWSMDLGKV
jgi:Domain of unknown function (DUF5710)